MTRRVRRVRLGPREVLVERAAGGVLLLRSSHPLGRYPDRLTDRLEFWAQRAPQRVLFAQRTQAGAWRTVTYGAALEICGNRDPRITQRGANLLRKFQGTRLIAMNANRLREHFDRLTVFGNDRMLTNHSQDAVRCLPCFRDKGIFGVARDQAAVGAIMAIRKDFAERRQSHQPGGPK